MRGNFEMTRIEEWQLRYPHVTITEDNSGGELVVVINGHRIRIPMPIEVSLHGKDYEIHLEELIKPYVQ